MPFWWPFGRKRRKNRRKSKDIAPERPTSYEKRGEEVKSSPAPLQQSKIARPLDRNHASPASKFPEHKSAVSRDQATSPEPIFAADTNSTEDITALPLDNTIERSPHLRPIYEPGSQPRQTNKAADETKLLRRKSSRRRKDDHLREQHVRDLSPISPLPRKHDVQAAALLKLEGIRAQREFDNGSEISLPMATSIRSSITAMSDNHFEVGSVDLFSARPRIRHSVQSPAISGRLVRSANPSRAESRKDSKKVQDMTLRQLKESKTIDNLADSYDAGTLRELMDRDQRRRERKHKAEGDRAKRRLERHAVKNEGKSSSRRKESPSMDKKHETKPSDRGDGRGLGLSETEVGTSRPAASRRKIQRREISVQPPDKVSPTFLDDRASEDVDTPVEEPIISTAQEIRYSVASISPTPSPIPREAKGSREPQSIDLRSGTMLDTTEATKINAGEPGVEPQGRKHAPFASVFRRGMPIKRRSQDLALSTTQGETSFSNTSRESMSRNAIPTHLREQPPITRTTASIPTRTMSKFREDLPELPVVPVESRVQSPEIPNISTLSARQREKLPEGVFTGAKTPELIHSNRNSTGSAAPASGAQMSQSLASVDSEASWLSGKPRKRVSGQVSPTPGAVEEYPDQGTGHDKGLEEPEEGYFRRELPNPGRERVKASGISAAILRGGSELEPVDSGVAETAEAVKSGNVDRKPTVNRQTRIKSNEGLLRQFNDDVDVDASDNLSKRLRHQDISPSSVYDDLTSRTVSHEARHARRVSSGSAKLLDIPSRRDSQRSSALSQASPPAS